MKNVVKSEHYYFPEELERALCQLVHHYNRERYPESLDNVTPADRYYGRYHQIMDQRAIIKQQTIQQRRCGNLTSYA